MGFEKTDKQRQAVDLIARNKYTLLYGGSRSGKTAIFIYSVLVRACKVHSRHAILRYRFNHAKASLWHDTIPKIMELTGLDKIAKFNNSDMFIEFPNGSTIWLGGLDDKDRTEKILGNEYSTIYFNEISQIDYDSILIGLTRLAENSGLKNKAFFDCNPPSPTHWAYKFFIKGKDPKSEKSVNSELIGHMLMNPEHNKDNLPDNYIEDTLENLPERQRKRFLLGEWVQDIEGALWNHELIERSRVDELPDMVRVVVAIDPAVTSNKNSDETGMIVCGKGSDGNCYILEDLSGTYTPNEWAKRAVFAYHKHMADVVIGEVNNGGDLVKTVIRSKDAMVNYKDVRASKGKFTRAEPIQGLYEQNKVKHYGNLTKLEEQMTSWQPESNFSPDRLDAMVWGVTDLMLKNEKFYIA